jgi:hypothetical protein
MCDGDDEQKRRALPAKRDQLPPLRDGVAVAVAIAIGWVNPNGGSGWGPTRLLTRSWMIKFAELLIGAVNNSLGGRPAFTPCTSPFCLVRSRSRLAAPFWSRVRRPGEASAAFARGGTITRL